MKDEVISLRLEEEFRRCPSCGYADGFHTMLKKEAGLVKWLFICPSCHRIFDIGFRADSWVSE